MLWYHWLLLAIVCIAIESFIPQFVLIWFAISSLFAAIASYLNFSPTFQITICIICGLLLLFLFRSKLAKKLHKNITPTNVNALVGQIGYVSELSEHNVRVTIDGIDWKAYSNFQLQLNQKVKIIKITGVTLLIEPLD